MYAIRSYYALKNITVDDMRAFLKSNLTKDRLVVGVSGDITPAELGVLLDEAFGGLPAKAATGEVPVAKPQGLGYTFVLNREVPQSVAVFGLPGLDREDPDFFAAYVMNHILGGGSVITSYSIHYTKLYDRRGRAFPAPLRRARN